MLKMGRWISLFSVKLKKESEIERGALNRYCEIEKGKKIKGIKPILVPTFSRDSHFGP